MPVIWHPHQPGIEHAEALYSTPFNAYRTQRLYLQALDKAKQAESKSVAIGWTIDKWDRSY